MSNVNPEHLDMGTAHNNMSPNDPKLNIIDIPSFGDFDLDLSCLSTASSPPKSDFGDDERIPSATASPSTLHRSLSIRSFSLDLGPRPRSISPKPSPSVRTVRGTSLPFTSRLGRGTPVDKNRRYEWGSRRAEPTEHGILFSELRSTSLDERRPRPMSPEWTLLTEALLNARSATLHGRTRSRSLIVDRSPALKIEGFGAEDTSDWASSTMKTVLDSTADIRLDDSDTPLLNFSTGVPVSNASDMEAPPKHPTASEQAQAPALAEPPAGVSSVDRAELVEADLEMDLGLDSPLDLELKVLEPETGNTRFHCSILHENLGTESPSVYSTPPPSPKQLSISPSLGIEPEERRDTNNVSSGHLVWWRKILRRIRNATFSLGHHSTP